MIIIEIRAFISYNYKVIISEASFDNIDYISSSNIDCIKVKGNIMEY